ncbi:uncharacterized protein LOC135598107 isoform X2 [Musa acuminata AAA Group]|uniref:(wild Malaysian banana) hypothetical protein n=1 Tax=Musa acuminata subsp. malaccensis TaxID=214687 RepID=A0A804HVP8_MUSAM|nr:unnamed protein product [Musa acuminata subsp. malaccensis]
MASHLPTRVKRKDVEMVCHHPSDSSPFSKTKKTRSLDGELAVFVKEKTATVQEPEPMECEEVKGELMNAEHEREREGRPSGVGDRGFHQLQEQSKAPDPPPNTAASLLWSGFF